MLWTLLLGTAFACSGLSETECLQGAANECCVWCANENGDGKCVGFALAPTSNCDAALSTHCVGYESASCFCCSTCAAATTNAVGAFSIVRSRGASLGAAVLMALVGLVNPRATPLFMLVFFLASLHLAEASLFDHVWLFAPEHDDVGPLNALKLPVGAAPHMRYVPLDANEAREQRRRAGPSSVETLALNITAFVTENFARTIVASQQRNRADVADLVTFQMNIPETAFVSGLTIFANNKYYLGKVVRREIAEQIFNDAVNQGQTAALLSSRGTSAFSVSMNTAAGTTALFTVTFDDNLQRRLGAYNYRVNINPGQVVPVLNVIVDIYNSAGVTDVKWSHSKMPGSVASITSTDMKRHIVLKYSPSTVMQMDQSATGLAEDVEVIYNVASRPSAGIMLFSKSGDRGSRNGDEVLPALLQKPASANEPKKTFFLHQFAAPDWLPASTLSVVLVIDRSGSMSGSKMTAARDALKQIIGMLRPSDRFGVVAFDDSIEKWRPTLSTADASAILQAQSYANTIDARGSTNISGALAEAVMMLNARTPLDANQPDVPAIVLLTDGAPTAGITNGVQLRQYIRNLNKNRLQVNTLGFGFDLDFALLEGIAADGDGVNRRIYVDTDSVEQLRSFFVEVSTPLLTNVEVAYAVNSTDYTMSSISRTNFGTIYKGSEIIVSGALLDFAGNGAPVAVTARVKARSCGCQISWLRRFVVDTSKPALVNAEKIWAFMTIKQLMVQALVDELIGDQDALGAVNKDLSKEKSIALALTYQFVTPYTSLVTVVVDDSTTTTTTTTGFTGTLPSTPGATKPSSGYPTTTFAYATTSAAAYATTSAAASLSSIAAASNTIDLYDKYYKNAQGRTGSAISANAAGVSRIVCSASLTLVSLLALLVV